MQNVTKEQFNIMNVYDAAVSKVPVSAMIALAIILAGAVGYSYNELYMENSGNTPMDIPEAEAPVKLDLLAPPQEVPPNMFKSK